MGYGWREVYDEASGIVTRSEYAREIEIAGKPLREVTGWVRFSENPKAPNAPENTFPSGSVTVPWISKLSETTNSWKSIEFTPGTISAPAKIRHVFLESTTTEAWELDGKLVAREATSLTYDAPQAFLSRRLNVIATQVSRLDGTRVETVNEYRQDDPARWLFGRLTKATVTKIGDLKKQSTEDISSNIGTSPASAPIISKIEPRIIALVNNANSDRKVERRVTAFTYDLVTGLLLSSTIEPTNNKAVTTTYERDKFGNIVKTTLSAIGEQERPFIVSYDLLGRFISVEQNALGHKTVYKRNVATGLPITITDPNNFSTTYTYDGFGRVRTETSPTGVITNINRLNGADVAKEAAAGLKVAYAEQVTIDSFPPELQLYDALGRLIRNVSQGFNLDPRVTRWVHVDRTYDRQGRVEKESLPYERGKQALWHRTTYDALNRSILVVQPDGKKIRTGFAGRVGGGRIVTKYDAKGQGTITELNTRDLPIAVVDVQGGRVTYGYDAGDRLEIMRGPTGAVTHTKYDDFGQRTQVTDPDLGVWKYRYDAFGQLTEQTDAEGQVTTLGYDLLGRIESKALSEGTTLEWEYDRASKGLGKLHRVRDSNRFIKQILYDEYGRPNRSAISIGTERGTETFTTTAELDKYGRVLRTHYPAPPGESKFVVENVYEKGFLVRVKRAGEAQIFWQALDIDEFGRVVKEDYGNGVETVTNYNKNTGELESTRAKKGSGSTILDLRLQYDAVGSVLKRHEVVQNIQETFTYDQLDRLKSATRSGGQTIRYEYDAAGRIKKKTGVGEFFYQSDRKNEDWQPHYAVLETRNGGVIKSYSYDLNGNRKSGNGLTILYTPDNLVREVRKNNTNWIRFSYGPSGERYRQLARNGQLEIETISIGGFEQVREYKADDPTTPKSTQFRYYLAHGNEVFAIVEKTKDHQNAVATVGPSVASSVTNTWYFHKDHLGSVMRVTNESGALAVRYWYDPWGQQIEANVLPAGQRFGGRLRQGFTGHEQLVMAGLIHMNGRVYDFETSMFLSADPVDLVTGYTQSIGRYAYVENNPLKYTDPTGYWKWGGGAIVGAVVGFATGGPGGAVAGFLIGGNEDVNKFVKDNWREIAIVTVAVVVTVALPGAGAMITGMAAGAASGATRAALYGGDFQDILAGAIKGGAIGGVSGAAFFGVGEAFTGMEGSLGGSLGSIGAHGVVGGGISEMQESGSFWKGFASGAFTKATSAYGPEFSGHGANVARAAVVGGTVAQISGGKFANGAIIGAYSYALNDALHPTSGNKRVVELEENNGVAEPSYFFEEALGIFKLAKGLFALGRYSAGTLWPAASGGKTVINGIEYTKHALERMQPVGTIMKGTESVSRGVPPSVVENAIKYGKVTPGNTSREVIRSFENVRVVTNPQGTRVITVIKTGN